MALLKFHPSQAENPLAAHAKDGSSAINLSNLIDNRTVLLKKTVRSRLAERLPVSLSLAACLVAYLYDCLSTRLS